MARTLLVTVGPSWPPVSGVDLRNWQNATALAELGPVRVASLLPPTAAESPDANIEIVGLTTRGEDRDDAFVRRHTSIDRAIPSAAIRRLRALVAEFRPDIAVLEGIALHPLLALLRPHVPTLVLDMHNIESDVAGQVRADRHRRAKWLSRVLDRDPERIRALETAAVRLVDQVWLCSAPDRTRLTSIAGSAVRAHIVPNGVPRADAFPSMLPPAQRGGRWPVVLFVGHLSYRPNVGAVRRLAGAIMPLVRQDFPQGHLLVVGRKPARKIRRLGARGTIEVIADPSSISEYLARAHVAVVPLTMGGGTRFKILEAMAAGVPVVATPLAAEGLELLDGVHVILAGTDAEMARGVETLCRDSYRWHRQRERARRHVMEVFGPAAISRAVRRALEVESRATE